MKATIRINYIPPTDDWEDVSTEYHHTQHKKLESGAILETFCSKYAMGACGSVVENVNIEDIPAIIKEIEPLSTGNPTNYNITIHRN